ncbi:hypothetical protein A6C57_00185 [Fibrella sp. ES10-3-2-2]|nr:hypothetical protein A6C57_00185 [Fibrella sp. ES10-3-2-2]
MNPASTPKNTIWKDISLVVLGALLSLASTYFIDWQKKPEVIAAGTRDSTWRATDAQKRDSLLVLQAASNQQLSKMTGELQLHSSLLLKNTESLTANFSDLRMLASKGSTADTSNLSSSFSKLSSDIAAIVASIKDINQQAGSSTSLARLYESRLREPANLTRVVLPRNSNVISAAPIDGQYFVGVNGEFNSGGSKGVYAKIGGRQVNMLSGDTAMIYTSGNNALQFTFEGMDEKSYVFGVNHLKR